jgi:GntR family transcriptional regulator
VTAKMSGNVSDKDEFLVGGGIAPKACAARAGHKPSRGSAMAMTRQREATERGQSAPMMDLSRSAIARYIQLATLFRRRIQAGHWKVGAQIPTVEELVEECGVARATVRQALGVLEKEGLIERFRAKGTFVTKHPEEHLWCQVYGDWTGLMAAEIEGELDDFREETNRPPRRFIHAAGEPAPSYRHYHYRRLRGQQPFMLADVHIDERIASRLPVGEVKRRPALRLIAELGIDIADARQTVTVGAADVETARDLDVPLNAPVAHVHLSAVDRVGCRILVSEEIYRGDVARFDIKLK